MPTNTSPEFRSANVDSWPIPAKYDLANVRAICYAIDNGIEISDLVIFLQKLSATLTEINAVMNLYENFLNVNMGSGRMQSIRQAFEKYAKENKIDAHKEACKKCKKVFIYWNLVSVTGKKSTDEVIGSVNVCSSCLLDLKKNPLKCREHRNSYLLDNTPIDCPLYGKKCRVIGYCNLSQCLHNHMEKIHRGYVERRWKKSKRFLSKTSGKIIKSDLMTGIEYEVVGKDKKTTRLNIFKLGKSIGIDNDHSIEQFHLNTELVTPPASGIKLEDMVYKTAQALQKDGFMANFKCGLHIHIDLFTKYGHINMNPQFYKSLLSAYVLYEDVFYKLVPKVRARNTNIRTVRERYVDYFIMPTNVEKLKFSKLWYQTNDDHAAMIYRSRKRHDSKYYWANFHSLLRKEGLEIRLMEGTLEANDILWWTRMNHDFIEAVAQRKDFYKTFVKEWDMMNRQNTNQRLESFMTFISATKEMREFVIYRAKQHNNSVERPGNVDENIARNAVDNVNHINPEGSYFGFARIGEPRRTEAPSFIIRRPRDMTASERAIHLDNALTERSRRAREQERAEFERRSREADILNNTPAQVLPITASTSFTTGQIHFFGPDAGTNGAQLDRRPLSTESLERIVDQILTDQTT